MKESLDYTHRLSNIKLPLGHKPEAIRQAVLAYLNLEDQKLRDIFVYRRGYDARKKAKIHFIYTLDLSFAKDVDLAAMEENYHLQPAPHMLYQPVFSETVGASYTEDDDYQRPVVIGTGPCGLFAALTLAQHGLKPLVLERGKSVRQRTKDTWGFWRKQLFKEESNVQFGEGGAGTFSDGKLWSQVKDPRYLGRKVMEEMVKGGAPAEILFVSKPHVGTFRLVKIVEYLRGEIERLGGEIRFATKVENVTTENGRITGLKTFQLETKKTEEVRASKVILSIGHSARDTFEMLHARGIFIEPKAFSIGFRIEHPQGLIDRARFGSHEHFPGHPEKIVEHVGAADYKLVYHAKNGRSVYSFCMCPGGTVVAATSEVGRVVTNGMSQYSRLERNANAGIVVGVEPHDFGADMQDPLAGIRFQQEIESKAFKLGGENYFAPGQLVGDFLKGKMSQRLGGVEPSYKPGVLLTDMTGSETASLLPDYVIQAIQEALPEFGKQLPGFDRPDSLLTGVETRTSAPIRIRRNGEKHPSAFESINTSGLYPAGEGAGYAGGIMSAAIDGIKVAEALAKTYQSSA